MSMSIDELLLAYARLGLQHWETKSQRVKAKARSIGVNIATKEGAAERAVKNPYEPFGGNGDPLTLIPMPCRQNRVFAAFFAPWLDRSAGPEHLSFDLVVLLQHGGSIAFRFEPGAEHSKTAHGYDHVQLNEELVHRQVKLDGAVSPLPTTYPAFPIPSEDTVTRFLAMVVAMHGFPNGIDDVFDDAFKGQPKKRKRWLDMTNAMLNRGS